MLDTLLVRFVDQAETGQPGGGQGLEIDFAK